MIPGISTYFESSCTIGRLLDGF